MAFNIFATATSDIPLANLDANFTLIGTASAASILYPTATTSITYGTTGTGHIFAGALVGPASATVFNTVSTTVNAFGAATTLNIGSASTTAGTVYLPMLTVTASNEHTVFRATSATSGYTSYYYNTSTLAGFVGNGASILSGAANTEMIFRGVGGAVLAYGNNRILTAGSAGVTIDGTLTVTGTSTLAAVNASGTGTFSAGTNSIIVKGGTVSQTNNNATSAQVVFADAGGTANFVYRYALNAGIGGTAVPNQLISTGNANDLEIYTLGAAKLVLGTNSTSRLSIDSAGAVTIPGTFTVGGDAVASVAMAINGTAGTSKSFRWYSAGVEKWNMYMAATTHMFTMGSTALANDILTMNQTTGEIVTGYSMKIGPTGTAALASGALTVTGAIGASTTLLVGDTTFSGIGTVGLIKSTVAGTTTYNSWNSATSGTRYHMEFRDGAGATVRGSITSDGTNTAFNTSSDIRLKDDLGISTNTSTLSNLKVHSFTWKESGQSAVGVFAQEAFQIAPHAVSRGTDDDDISRPWSVDYSKLVPDLIVGWQSHNEKIAALEQRLTKLEQ